MDEMSRILRVGGGWGNVSGPGLAMIRALTTSIVTSVFMGMTGATFGVLIFDAATIPFLVSAATGFTLGAIGFYKDGMKKALRALDRYPRLIQLHLDANFPHRLYDTWHPSDLRSQVFASNWKWRSHLLVAYISASATLERIREAKEDELVIMHAKEEALLEISDGKGED